MAQRSLMQKAQKNSIAEGDGCDEICLSVDGKGLTPQPLST